MKTREIEIPEWCMPCRFITFPSLCDQECTLYEHEINIDPIKCKPQWCKAKKVIVEEEE